MTVKDIILVWFGAALLLRVSGVLLLPAQPPKGGLFLYPNGCNILVFA